MQENKTLGKSVKEALSTYQSSPQPEVWDSTERRMKLKKKRGILFWLFLGSGLLLLSIGSVIGYSWGNYIKNNATIVNMPLDQENKDSNNHPIHSVEKLVTDQNETDVEKLKEFDNVYYLQENRPTNKLKQKKTVSRGQSALVTNSKSSTKVSSVQKVIAPRNNGDKTPNKETEVLVTATDEELYTNSTKTSLNETSNVHGEVLELLSNKVGKSEKSEPLEKQTKEQKTDDKNWAAWSVTVHGIGNYFFNTKDGNFLSSSSMGFNPTTTIDLNYGVTLNYIQSERWQARIGVNKVQLSKKYDGVASNIELSDLDLIRSFIDQPTLEQFTAGNDNNSITQRSEIIQIPIELRYQLFKKNPEFWAVAGLSYMLITNNRVFIKNKERTILLGKNKYLKDFNINAHIGLGYRKAIYKDKILLNADLLFNYQLGAYPEVESIAPAFLSPQLGIEYKF
jgi:hypothetical protein